jgi:hypothetical protein
VSRRAAELEPSELAGGDRVTSKPPGDPAVPDDDNLVARVTQL